MKIFTLTFLAIATVAGFALAEDKKSEGDQGWVQIFDGKTLEGW